MNIIEKKMLDNLLVLKERFGVVAVKAEFEAEGTRSDELLRLLEIVNKANLKFALKIGGCEAIRDLIESKTFGCDYIIAPMIESSYGLSKFISAKEQVYGSKKNDCEFLFNLETKTCFENKIKILKLAAKKLSGVVFGRVDYCSSLGKSRNFINDKRITKDVIEVSSYAKKYELDVVVGGGVSFHSIPALIKIKKTLLSRFETRKIIFSSASLENKNLSEGLLRAVQFELDWLKNKRNFYKEIYIEDSKRIKMLETRWKKLISKKVH